MTGVRHGNAYHTFTADPASLGQLAKFLDDFDGMLVTFNGAHFDLPLLDGYYQRFLGRALSFAQHYDLMRELEQRVGYRISLDRLAQYTIGDQKLPWDHRQNRRIWAEEPGRLIEYNRRDLDLTWELYQRVLNGQHLFTGDATVLLAPPIPW
jgi:DEAD/DEAH box helicase domain-containing protein